MWRKLALTGWYVSVGILVFVAVAISIARSYPSLYRHYLPDIQGNISSIMGKPVYIKGIDIVWRGYTPLITVEDLAIYSDDARTKQLLSAKRAHLSFYIYESLIQGRLNVRQLTLEGSSLEAVRTADQRIVLNGIDISEKLSDKENLENRSEAKISLLNSTIAVRDEIRNLDYFIDRADITFGFYEGRLRLTSNFLLPESLGNSLTLIADVKDLDKGLNNVRGNLYAKGNSINLDSLGDFFPHFQAGIKTGNSDFEVWGNFESSLQRSFSGRLNIRDLQYHHVEKSIDGIATGQEITSLGAHFQIEGEGYDWHLMLADSAIQAAGEQWPGEKYEIKCIDCNSPGFSIAAALDYVDSNHLLSVLQHYPVFTASLERLLAKVRINGVLKDANILARWDDGQLSKYSYETFLQDAKISIPGQEFEVSSLAGMAHGNHLQGNLEIDAPDLHIQAGNITDNSFEGQKVAGVVKWEHTDHGVAVLLENVALEAQGINANLQGSIRVDDGKFHFDLKGGIPKAQFATVRNYLPFKKMPPKLVKWLKEGASSGTLSNTRFLFRGNPEHFPFENHRGMFQVATNVTDGVLDYRKDWPTVRNLHADLKIENEHLMAVGYQSTILRSSIERITATIDNLKLPRLVINGRAIGPPDDILNYLQQAALIPQNSQISRHISVEGDIKLNLNLALTLTGKLEKERNVDGVIEFDDTDLTITSVPLPFENIRGKLKFNRHGFEAQNLSTDLYGSAFNVVTQSLENGRTLLIIKGDFNFDSYFAANHRQINEYISGTAPVKVMMNLPQLGKHDGDKSLTIDVKSNLTGASIALPEPFYKEAGDSRSFTLHTKYQMGKSPPLFANFDDMLFMQASFNGQGRTGPAMELRMGDNQFSLPEKGLKVSGEFGQLNLADWKGVFASSDNGSFPELYEIDAHADAVFISGLEIQDADFLLLKKEQSWIGRIDSSIAKGSFNYPLDVNATAIATADFDYLHLPKPEEEIIEIDPRKLPALEIHAKQFEFNDYPFHNVTLKTTTIDDGMVINSLTGEGEDLQVEADGTWLVVKENIDSTDLDIALTTQNLHNSLTGLGFDTGIGEGQGRISARFNWTDAPYRFSVENLTGKANIRLKDGKILSVEPGVGRLVGLFNLGEISKRLSLDFADFFSKDYVFDKIRGDLFFENANLTTENLSITGSSADLLITGRTGIAARDYDQIVTVTPHVAGGLPWIGLAVGGPLGAVGVYVGEKVAQKMGIDVNKVTEVKYSVTGSWDDPKIEPISKVEASPSEQTQP